MFKRTAIVSKDSLALAFVESALPFSLILEFAKIHLFLNLSSSLFILFGCKITPSMCNLFARWFFYLFFSVFYSLYSGFIKMAHPFFQKQLQRYEIIPHLHKNIISNFLIFHINEVRGVFFIYFSVFSILSVLVSLNSPIHSFAFIASLLFHLALSPPNVHPYQAPHGG